MTFLPIVGRELRLAARRTKTYLARSAAALVGASMGLGVIGVSLSMGSLPAEIGHQMFYALSLLALGFCLLAGPILTADALSEEKREGTLGLLLLTDLRSYDLVAGKLVSALLPAWFCLLAILPVLSLSFFLGGVMPGELARMALVLIGTLFFSLAAGLVISSVSRHGRNALTGTLFLIALITLGLPVWGYLSGQQVKFSWTASWLATPSPVFAFVSAEESIFAATPEAFWRSVLWIHLLSWLFLALASFLLPRAWQDRSLKWAVAINPANPWSQTRRAKAKSADPASLLEANPMLWLASRQRLSPAGIWLFLGATATLCLWCHWEFGHHTTGAREVFAGVYFFHSVLKIWIAWEASRRLAEDRKSGALELLLTTPLAEKCIWNGWLIGLKRRFLGPVMALAAADLVLFWNAMSFDGWHGDDSVWAVAFLATLGLFIADSYTLGWAGLWLGLTARNSTHAVLRTLGTVCLLPWAAFLGGLGVLALLPVEMNLHASPSSLVAAWFGVGYVCDLGLCGWVMVKMNDEFRAAASR